MNHRAKSSLTKAASSLLIISLVCLGLSARAATVAISGEPPTTTVTAGDDLLINSTNSGAGTYTTHRINVGSFSSGQPLAATLSSTSNTLNTAILARLTNSQTGVTLSGTFSGNGNNLSSLNGAAILAGTVTPAQTSFLTLTNGVGAFPGAISLVASNFIGAGNAAGDFIGNGSALTNLPVFGPTFSLPLSAFTYNDGSTPTVTRDAGWQYVSGFDIKSNSDLTVNYKVPCFNAGLSNIITTITLRAVGTNTFATLTFNGQVVTNKSPVTWSWAPSGWWSTNVQTLRVTNAYPDDVNAREFDLWVYRDGSFNKLTNELWIYDITTQFTK